MSKFLYSNTLIACLSALFITFFCCDGSDRKQKLNVEDFNESKLLDSLLESTKYFPETYFETITDSTLSNGFKVIIKTYTDMNNSVLNKFKVDSIVHKHYYRDAISEITIFKENVEILSETINKSYFLNRDKGLKEYFEIANLSGVWLNQNDSNTEHEISIFIMFCKPETENCFLNEMVVSSNGKYTIKEIIE